MAFTATSHRMKSESKAIPNIVSPPLTIPEQIGNISLWFKGDVGVNADVSNKVSVWADQSGNGNNALQATATYQPIFGNDARGSYVEFVSSNGNRLTFPTVDLVGSTIYVCGLLRPNVATESWYEVMPSNNGAWTYMVSKPTNQITTAYVEDFNGSSDYYAINPPLLGTNPYLASMYYALSGNLNNSYGYSTTSGTPIVDRAFSTNKPHTSIPINMLGQSYPNTSRGIVRLYEVVVFNGALSVQQKADMKTYFSDKYGVTFL